MRYLAICLCLSATVGVAQDALQWQMTQFERAEAALADAMSTAQSALPQAEFEALAAKQDAWLVTRERTAERFAAVATGLPEEATHETPDFFMVRARLTNWRAEIVTGLVAYYTDPAAYTWDGVWSDGAGGELAVRQLADGRLQFRLSANRGPNYHTGRLEGTAIVEGATARFETNYERGRGMETVSVTLAREGPTLSVLTHNAQFFHGDEAYFDAEYIRVRDLRSYDLE